MGKSSIVHRFVYDAFRSTMESTIGSADCLLMFVVECSMHLCRAVGMRKGVYKASTVII